MHIAASSTLYRPPEHGLAEETARSVRASTDRIVRAVLLFLLILASGYRVWLVFAYNPMDWVFSDPARHWYAGTHPLDTAPMAAIDPMLYGAYLSVMAKFTAGSPILVAYWTALLSLSCPWIWYRFLRELVSVGKLRWRAGSSFQRCHHGR